MTISRSVFLNPRLSFLPLSFSGLDSDLSFSPVSCISGVCLEPFPPLFNHFAESVPRPFSFSKAPISGAFLSYFLSSTFFSPTLLMFLEIRRHLVFPLFTVLPTSPRTPFVMKGSGLLPSLFNFSSLLSRPESRLGVFPVFLLPSFPSSIRLPGSAPSFFFPTLCFELPFPASSPPILASQYGKLSLSSVFSLPAP